MKNRACIRREDEKHNAIAWLTGEIHVDFPGKNNAGIMQVSATEPDREDAAAIVNAVVRPIGMRSSISNSSSDKNA